jgi:zinc protease
MAAGLVLAACATKTSTTAGTNMTAAGAAGKDAVGMTGTPDAEFRHSAPEPGKPIAFRPPVPREVRLSNGLAIWVVERHEVPLVSLDLVLRSGSDTEAAGQAGLASLALDLLDEGTATRDSIAIARAFEDLAARYRTSVDADSSHLVVTALSSTLPEALEVFSDVALNAAFRADDVERVRAQRLGQIAQILDDPAQIADHVLRRVLYGEKHPWAFPAEGTVRTIKSIPAAALARWHATWFRPNNAALIVSGDVRTGELVPMLERAFAGWKPARLPQAHRAPPRSRGARSVVVVDRPGAPQSQIFVGEIGIESTASDKFPARIMNLVLGGSFNSRLNINLRTEHGWSYGAFSAFEEHRQAGPFVAQAGVMAEHTAAALAETFREIRRMQQGEVTDAELDDAKESLMRAVPGSFLGAENVAERYAAVWAHGLPIDYYAHYVENVGAVTKADVARAARERLHPDRAAIVVVGPLSQVDEALGSLGFGAVELRDAEGEAAQARRRP